MTSFGRQYYHCQHGVHREFCTICKGRFLPDFPKPSKEEMTAKHYEAVRELFLRMTTSGDCFIRLDKAWSYCEELINFAESRRPGAK